MGLKLVIYLIKRKKIFKKIFIVSLLATIILLSNVSMLNNSDLPLTLSDNSNSQNEEFIQNLETSNLNLTNDITGAGTNQTVKLFVENSSSTEDKGGYFNLKGPEVDDLYLSSGDFNFNFNNNYTTDFIIEDDDALFPSSRYFEEYVFDRADSDIEFHEGIEDPYGEISDLANNNNYWNVTSENGIVNFTIIVNFTDATYRINDPGENVPFDPDNIIGIFSRLRFRLNRTANLTIQMKEFYGDQEWKTFYNQLNINHTLGQHTLENKFVNENLKFINRSTEVCQIRFIFNRTDTSTDYNVSLYEGTFRSFMVLELPIWNGNQLALEFDLRGENSTVNGFHGWIRTLNLTAAKYGYLNISLFKANNSMDRTQNNLRDLGVQIKPDYENGYLDSIILDYNNYTGDSYTYFNFNIDNTNNLTRYNYFIVITSNVTEPGIYSLVSIPGDNEYGDNENTEHQLKESTNGIVWENAVSDINVRSQEVSSTSYLDASLFKLNVTRAYMPSDFELNDEPTLRIENEEFIDNVNIRYLDGPDLKWGLGRWNYNFSEPIENGGSYNFLVNLTWNSTNIKGFTFTVDYYAEIFRNDNATTYYSINYEELPIWKFNYSLDLENDPIFQYYWNFSRFWYLYPDYFTAYNLTTPEGSQVLDQTYGEFFLYSNPYEKLLEINKTNIVNTSEEAKFSGIYSLNLTSEQPSVFNMFSYINFDGTLWKTNGFMYGDNISMRLDVQDPYNVAPSTNNAYTNLTLFYPNGTAFPDATIEYSDASNRISDTLLTYDFGNSTILNVSTSNVDVFGEYTLGFFWSNGSLIGCQKIPIYIDAYNISITDVDFYESQGVNILEASSFPEVISNYTILIASVNETTGQEGLAPYSFNNTEINEIYTYTKSGKSYPIKILTYLQNESVLNSNENLKIDVSIQNLYKFFGLEVKIHVKLVSVANEDWIIANGSSQEKLLAKYGDITGGDTDGFSVDLNIPEFDTNELTWTGLNAPIRQGGVKSIVTVFIEGNNVGTYELENISLIISETDDVYDGQILSLNTKKGNRQVLQGFERDECLYLPEISSFIMNVYDPNYVSTYDLINFSKGLKSDSQFTQVEFNPETIIEGKIFNISADLSTEFGRVLANKKVYCQYFDGNMWKNATTPQYSNANGTVNFAINTKNIEVSENQDFRLVWDGDSLVLNNTINITVPIVIQTNSLGISADIEDNSFIYRNTDANIEMTIRNTGNSDLRILSIDFDIEDDLDWEIIEINEIKVSKFQSGDSIDIILEIEVDESVDGELDIIVIVTAQNLISGETVVIGDDFTIDVVDRPWTFYLIDWFIILMIAILVLIFIIAVLYAKKIKKRLEAPLEKKEKARPRKGRYVKVSEIPEEKKEEPKEIVEKPEEEKVVTDLDTLI
ncbi:MAG: hypothetical protein GF383_16575, partial [Candidatus Lokiarchaeota archaeon]|nr:hypothetical protein [Candidatus Lokiarchaeota archaeon]MBD3343402.1 hypothetical protein [Candidatus Lokiarchaeota archaeon]